MERRLILDRYRPLADLGEGGFGSVVLAYDTRMTRRVAIKRLPLPRDASGKPFVHAGLAEARTAALLNHPNIVTVYEWDTDLEDAFLIMEHVDGVSLADLLESTDERLTPDETAAILEDVGEALTFAHSNGVLHLDIKPDNILVTRNGVAKVADFGVSQLTDLYGGGAGAGGTLGYMPPEQLGDRTVDARSDEWALAAVAFRLLAGVNPYEAHTIEDAIVQAEVVDPPRISEYDPHLPAIVGDVLLAALSPHRVDRYPSVREFTEALTPYLGDVAAGRESLGEAVSSLTEDVVDADTAAFQRLGLWDRLIVQGNVLRRAGAAAAGFWLAGTSLAQLDLGQPATWTGAGLVALAGALAPGMGLGLGLLAVVAATFARAGAFSAFLVLLVLGSFWWTMGRRGRNSAVVPVLAPFFGVARIGLAVPLIMGYAYPPLQAAVASGLSSLTLMLAAAACGAPKPYLDVPVAFLLDPWASKASSAAAVLSDPGAYVVVLGWAIAGAVASLVCARATRPAGAAGAVAGMAWMTLAYLVWATLDITAAGSFPGPSLLSQQIGSLILMALVVAAGPPTRGENG